MSFTPENMRIPCPTCDPLWDLEESRHQEYLRRVLRAQELYKQKDDSPEANKLYKTFVEEHNRWQANKFQIQHQEYIYARFAYRLRVERWKRDWQDVTRGLAPPSEFKWNSTQSRPTYDEWNGTIRTGILSHSLTRPPSISSLIPCVSSTIGISTSLSNIINPMSESSKHSKVKYRRRPLDGLFDHTLEETQSCNIEDEGEFSKLEFLDLASPPIIINNKIKESPKESSGTLTPPADLLTESPDEFIPGIATQNNLLGGDIIKVVDHKPLGKSKQNYIYCVLWKPYNPRLKLMWWWTKLPDMIDKRAFVDEYHIKKGLGDVQWPFFGKGWKKKSSATLGVREIKRTLEDRKRELLLHGSYDDESYKRLADERWCMRDEWQRLGRGWGTARQVVQRRIRAWDEFDLFKEWSSLNRKNTLSDMRGAFSPHFSDGLQAEDYRSRRILIRQRSEPALQRKTIQGKQIHSTLPISPSLVNEESDLKFIDHRLLVERLQAERESEDETAIGLIKNTEGEQARLSGTESIDIITFIRRLSIGKRDTDGKASPFTRACGVKNSNPPNSPLRTEANLDGMGTVPQNSELASLRSVSPRPTMDEVVTPVTRKRNRFVTHLVKKISRTLTRSRNKTIKVVKPTETTLITTQDTVLPDSFFPELDGKQLPQKEDSSPSLQNSDSGCSGVQENMNEAEETPELPPKNSGYIFCDGLWSPAYLQDDDTSRASRSGGGGHVVTAKHVVSRMSETSDDSHSSTGSQTNIWLDGVVESTLSKTPQQLYDETIKNPDFLDSASMVSNTTATSMPRGEITVREPRVTGPDSEGFFKIAYYTGPQLPPFLWPECGCKPPRVCGEHIHEWVDFLSRPYTPNEATSWTEVYKNIRDRRRRDKRNMLRFLKLQNRAYDKLQQTISDIKSGYRSLKDLPLDEYEILMADNVSGVVARGVIDEEQQRNEEYIQEKLTKVFTHTKRLQELMYKPKCILTQEEEGELRYLQRRCAKRSSLGFSEGYELARAHAREGKLVLGDGTPHLSFNTTATQTPLTTPVSCRYGTLDGTGFSRQADIVFDPAITPTSATSKVARTPESTTPSRDPLENLTRLRDCHRRERLARLAELKAESDKHRALKSRIKISPNQTLPHDAIGNVVDFVHPERNEMEKQLRRREEKEQEREERYAREEERYLTLILQPRDELTGHEQSELRYLRKRVHTRCTWREQRSSRSELQFAYEQ